MAKKVSNQFIVNTVEDGEDAAVATCTPDKISIQCNTDGSVASSNGYNVTFAMKVGTNDATITGVSYNSAPSGVSVSSLPVAYAKTIAVYTSATATGMAQGITFTVTGTYNGNTYSAKVSVALIGVTKGSAGERGKVGRFYYYGGVFNQLGTTPFTVNDAQAPYFEHTESNQKRYHVYNPATNPSGNQITEAQMWAVSNQSWNNAPWEAMTNDFKYLITQALFSDYAHLGSWIFNADFMMSEKGTGGNGDNGTRGTALFNGIGSNTGFKPNVVIDAFNGQASFGCDKIRFNADGSGHLAGGNIEWDVLGNTMFAGLVKKKKTIITSSNIDYYSVVISQSTGYRYLLYDKTGCYIEFQTDSIIFVWLPTVGSVYTADIMRGLVGNVILILNSGSFNIVIMSDDMRSPSGTSVSSVYLGQNKIASLECCWTTENGREVIYWEIRVGNAYSS